MGACHQRGSEQLWWVGTHPLQNPIGGGGATKAGTSPAKFRTERLGISPYIQYSAREKTSHPLYAMKK
jgi:hypothetical protein